MTLVTRLPQEQIIGILGQLTHDGVVLPGTHFSNPDYWRFLFEGRIGSDRFTLRRITRKKYLYPYVAGRFENVSEGTVVILHNDSRQHFIQMWWIVGSIAVPIYLLSIVGAMQGWFSLQGGWDVVWLLIAFASPFLFVLFVRIESNRRLAWTYAMLRRVLVPEHAASFEWVPKFVRKVRTES